MVKAMLAWPSRSLTTLTGTPALMSRVPWVWRRSWRRMTGTPARRAIRSKVGVTACGWIGLAVAVGEHPPVELDAGRGGLGALQRPPGVEHRQRRGVEVDGAAGVAGLASGLVQLVADGDEPAVEREPLALEVDVVPLEPEDLVAAHPGHRR